LGVMGFPRPTTPEKTRAETESPLTARHNHQRSEVHVPAASRRAVCPPFGGDKTSLAGHGPSSSPKRLGDDKKREDTATCRPPTK